MSNQTYSQQPLADRQKYQRTRLYSAIRIVDGRIQGLCSSDPEDVNSEPAWADWGAETIIWEDREDAYQTARANQGLLVSVDGLPIASRLLAYQAKVRRLRVELGDTFPVAAPKPPVEGVQEAPKPGPNDEVEGQTDEQLVSRREAVEQARAARASRKKSGTVIPPVETPGDDIPF